MIQGTIPICNLIYKNIICEGERKRERVLPYKDATIPMLKQVSDQKPGGGGKVQQNGVSILVHNVCI